MSISLRDDLVNEIKSTLETITTGNGYNLTVNLVTEDLKDLYEENEDNFPVLYVTDGLEDSEDKDVDAIQNDLNILIIGYVKEPVNDVSTAPLLRKLMADVEKCLCADRGRNGIAFQTLITAKSTDEGTLMPFGVMNMNFIIKYNQAYGDPTAGG